MLGLSCRNFQMLKNKKYFEFQYVIETLSRLLTNSQINSDSSQQAAEYYKKSVDDANKSLQLAMLEIYDDIYELQADCFISVFQKLINLLNRLQNRVLVTRSLQLDPNSPQKNIDSNTNINTCSQCSQLLYKKQIDRMMKQFNLYASNNKKTQGCMMSQQDARNLQQENTYGQEQDILNYRIHISRIQELLNSEAKYLIENKNHDSITKKYLMDQSSSFMEIGGADLSEMVNKARQNFRNYQEVNNVENKAFAENIINALGKVMGKFFKSNIQKMLKKRIREMKPLYSECYVQTDEYDFTKKLDKLQKNIESKDKMIERLRESKRECDKSILSNIERTKQIQIKLMEYKQNCSFMEKQYSKTLQQYQDLKFKMNSEISAKNNQIESLKTALIIQRKKLEESQNILANISRKTIDKRNSSRNNSMTPQEKGGFSKKMIVELQNQFRKTQANMDGMKKSNSQLKFTNRLKNHKVSGFFNYNQENQSIIENQDKQNLIQQEQLVIQNIESEENIIEEPQLQEQVIQFSRAQQRANSKISSLSIQNQFSLQINQTKGPQLLQALDANNICLSLLSKISLNKNSRRESKNKFGYRVFKPTRVNLLKQSKQNETFSKESKNIQQWMNKMIEINKEAANQKINPKNNSVFYGNIYGQKVLKTQGDQLNPNRQYNSRLEKLNATRVTVGQIKEKNRRTNPIEKLSSQGQSVKSKKKESLLNFSHLYIFGGEKSAMQFEKNEGIWPHLYTADKLILDFENTFTSSQIQKYFNELYESSPEKYNDYTYFLFHPMKYLNNKKANLKQNFQLQKNSIRILFNQFIRFHRIHHKNCTHISEFLSEIGFQCK